MEKGFTIDIKNVSIYQENTLVLKNINLKIKSGEICFLIGKTGSGKSSLLNFLYGEIPLKKGSARIFDQELKNISSKKLQFIRRNFGIIPQEIQLFEDKHVFENLRFFLRATSFLKKDEIESKINKALEILEIDSLKEKYLHELSGGEKKKVAIARAIISSPKVILADEPSSHMDKDTSKFILDLLIKRAKKINASLIIATHDSTSIENLGGQILKIEKGEINFS